MLSAGQPDSRSVLSSGHGARFAAACPPALGTALSRLSGVRRLSRAGSPATLPITVPLGFLAVRLVLTEAERKKAG